MERFVNIVVADVNALGRGFCTHAAAMLVQSGILIVVLLAVDLLLRRRVRATLRYWVWMLVFIKLVLPPTFSLPTGIGYWVGGYTGPQAGVLPPVREAEVMRLSAGVAALPEVGGGRPVAAAPLPGTEVPPAAVEPIPSVAVPAEHLTWQGGVWLLWALGVAVFAALVGQRLVFVRRLIRQAQPATGEMLDLLDQCRWRMGVRRRLGLKLSPTAFSPAVCGLVRPTILIPVTLVEKLTPDNLRAVLLHELAHVKRADLWVNCVQTALQIIYFYNPLVWLANALVRRVREQAVDEIVLVALGAEARSYGRTLIDIAEMTFLRASPALALVGVAESKKSFEGRIKHMIARPMPTKASVGARGLAVVLGVAAVLLPMAQAQKQEPAVPAPQARKGQSAVAVLDGVTVELVGVCRNPNGQEPRWWRPDGTPMDESQVGSSWGRGTTMVAGYLLKFTPAQGMTYRSRAPLVHWPLCVVTVIDPEGHAGVMYKEPPNGSSPEPLPELADIEVEVAAGAWSTDEPIIWSRFGVVGPRYQRTAQTPDGYDILLSGLRSNPIPGETLIDVTTNATNVDICPECTTADGRRLAGRCDLGPLFPDGHLQQRTFSLEPSIEEMRTIVIKQRPFRRIVFRNVSLRPGHKTDAGIEGRASGQETTRLPNLFVLAPAQVRPPLFGAVLAKAGDWTWNKTGRDLASKSCVEIFDGTHGRTDHDVLALLFALDREERIPAGYEDLLPLPWTQIQERLQRGEIVELVGKARDLNVVVLAAPRVEQLPQAIADSRVLGHPKELLGSSGAGCDVAIEECRVVAVPERGTFAAHVSIRNRGRAASPQFIVDFYLGDPKTAKPMIHGAGPIQPDGVWNESSQPFGLKEGVNQVQVALDPAGMVDELDRTNNRVLVTVEVHDGQIVKQQAGPIAAQNLEKKGGWCLYPVGRSVADFPSGQDLSTPEAAYATINRLLADGDTAGVQRVSLAALGQRIAREARDPKRAVDREWANVLNQARILEVMVWKDTRAAVTAQLPQELSSQKIVAPIDVRYLQWQDGRWLNAGNDRFWTVEEAKAQFSASVEKVGAGQEADLANLSAIGKACLLYATDHDDKLPPDLQTLVQEANLPPTSVESQHKPEYFRGPSYVYIPGQNLAMYPGNIVVYENPAFCTDGIGVLFLDSHVEFMKTEMFREELRTTCARLGKAVPELTFQDEAGVEPRSPRPAGLGGSSRE
jgi:beta-lactamase regulating signal transducer with metallopeptidase domain